MQYSQTVEASTAQVDIPHLKVDQPVLNRMDFDLGLSWTEIARYKGLMFNSAGTFKLCWCDSAAHGSCVAKEDYTIEVGKIHVSGVSCLISDTRFRAMDCRSHFHGGLSCYTESISLTIPTVSDSIVLGTYPSAAVAQAANELTTFCMFSQGELTNTGMDICQLATLYQDGGEP